MWRLLPGSPVRWIADRLLWQQYGTMCRMAYILLALVGLSSVVEAADWYELPTTSGGSRYVDRASVKRNGRFATVVIQVRFDPTVQSKEHFDCTSRTMKVIIERPLIVAVDGGLNPQEPLTSVWLPVSRIADRAAMYRIVFPQRYAR